MELQEFITSNTPANIFEQFLESQNEKFWKNLRNVRRHQNDKFANLLQEQITRDIFTCFNESWIENTTNVELPVEMRLLLSFGPKFCLNSGKLSEKDCFKIICDVENILKIVHNHRERIRIRNNLVGFIQNSILTGNSSLSRTEKYLNNILDKTIEFIRDFNNKNPGNEIMITVSDKGGKSVVIYKKDYEKYMQEMLADRTTYFEIRKDPTGKFQRLNNSLIKSATDLKMMNEWTRRSLLIHKSVAPKIYLLPKIHKFEINELGERIMKYRPIVSCINSPSYKMGKFIGQIIHNSIDHNIYNIKNSYDFQEFITKQQIPPGYILLSLDVVNLFGCLPRTLIYECIIYEWDNIKMHTQLNLIKKLIKIHLTSILCLLGLLDDPIQLIHNS
jgi:hypothetical protein